MTDRDDSFHQLLLDEVRHIRSSVVTLDDKMDVRLKELGDTFHAYEVTQEGRMTKVETKTGIIATVISVFVAFIGWLVRG